MTDIPEFVGRFPIQKTLGIGGMGVVYLAKDPDIGRKVAIKVLHATDNHEALERFKNEARTMGEISHPNIVVLLEYGIDNNKPFLVMEYLEGLPLEKWMNKPHSLKEYKKILLNICDALQFTHNKDILHRDLKPDNIQVLPSGEAKLLDFGIASGKNTGLTATGFFIGTPKYLAPEILQDTTHTKKSDCYSLGLLAYTMLRGANPYSAESFEATMTRVLTKIPAPLHKSNPNIPIELSDAIGELLDKNPDKRPKTTKNLKMILELMTNQKLLNKIIVSTANSESQISQEKTIVFRKHLKSNTIIITFSIILIALISTVLFYNNFLEKNNVNIKPVNEPIVINHKRSDSDMATKASSDTENLLEKTNSPSVTINESLDKLEEEQPTSSEQSNIIQVPINSSIIGSNKNTTEKKSEPIKIAITENKENAVTKEKLENPNIQHQNIQKQPSREQEVSIATNKSHDNPQNQKIDRPTIDESSSLVAIQIPQKKPVNIPVFELPQLKMNTRRVSLETSSDRQIPRGRTQTLRINIPNEITIEKYKIMKGLTEFNQVEIKKIKLITNNLVEIKLYAQSNAQMGNFSIIGFYQNKKTKPLILEVTL